MKKSIKYFVFAVALSGLLSACLKKEEQKAQPVVNQTLTVSAVKTQAKDVELSFE